MRIIPAFALVCSASLLSIGCLDQASAPPSETLGIAEQATVWGNGNDPIFFWEPSSQTALVALGQNALESAGAMVSTPLALTSSGQKLLGFVIGCALPAGTSVYSPEAGVSFDGAVGLAPEWASGPLAGASQRWMTACLLQTLNGLGVHVPIRLSGENPALADQPDAGACSFTVADATTFGNLFTPGGGVHACSDITLVGPLGFLTTCGVQVSIDTLLRVCGLSPTCGITTIGACSHSCDGAPGSETCTDRAGNVYAETISVTLQRTIAISLYPLCLL